MVNRILAKKNILLPLILLLGFFLRVYNFQELFYYTHDNDLAGWFIRDVLVNHHLRLIGQETSSQGIFIGPLFYYLQIPFYLLTGLDPIGGTFLVALLGTFTVWSFYFVFSKIWNKSTGLIGASIYAFSFYTILGDREVVPTMPVILWSLWFFYSLWLLQKGKQKWAWPILGILVGLIWHLNFALVLVVPLILVAWWLGSRHPEFISGSASNMGTGKRRMLNQVQHDSVKFDIKALLIGVVLCIIFSLPLIIFEVRHGFQQVHALISALTTDQHDIVSGTDKIVRTFHLASKNVTNLLWGSLIEIKYEWIHICVLAVFAYLLLKKYIDLKLGLLMVLWLFLFMAFFSSYSKILSEYYLNGMIVIYIAILAVGLSMLLSFPRPPASAMPKALRAGRRESNYWWLIGIILVTLFACINLYRIFTIPVNRSGYVDRKAIIEEIKRDSDTRNYPCVSISYITNPGNNLGYRYFIWRANIKTKPISNEVPVYTIVFPLKPIFQEDKSFGAIGLIYPEYSKYNTQTIHKSCEGSDWNLEESMFGFTN